MTCLTLPNDRLQPIAIQKYINLALQGNMISFAAGLPDLSVLPIEQLREAYALLANEPRTTFQYQLAVDSLTIHIQAIMANKSVPCSLDEILIVQGAQQGIYLAANLFFKEKRPFIIDEFVYPGLLQVANLFALDYLPVSATRDGMDLNQLEDYMKRENVLPYLYVVANGHNPLGSTLSHEQRQQLAYLAEKYHFILIEDDAYGFLSLSDEAYRPLRAYTSNAIYISSFSKIISPAVRTGWVVGEKAIIRKLSLLKDIIDLGMSNLNHVAISSLLDRHRLTDIVAPQQALYKQKRDFMLSMLKQYLSIPFHYVMPRHGFFIWLTFPTVDIEGHRDFIFEQAQVLFMPGSAFSTHRTISEQAIRLNFSYPSFEDIESGIKKLGGVLNALEHGVKSTLTT